MNIQNALASLPVKNLDSALLWYEKLLGRHADSKPMAQVAEWQFNGGGWLQIYQANENAGRGSVTLAVGDLSAQIDDLIKIGIDAGPLISEEKVDVVMIKDPDGNSIAFAYVKDKSIAH